MTDEHLQPSNFVPPGAIEVGEVEYWASLGNSDRVKMAIVHGASVNATSQNGHTALHAAATNGHLEVIEVLLANGANPNAQLQSGEAPADLARLAGFESAASRIEHRLR